MWKRGFKDRKNTIILLSIFVASIALMTLNIKRSPGPFFFETALLWVVSPVQNLFTNTVNSISETVDHYLLLVDTSKENKNLKRRVEGLLKQNHDLREEILLLNRVESLIRYQEEHELNAIVSRVIGRDATQWGKMVFIDKGTQDGIEENIAVVTEEGVVGHVIQAGRNTSKVLLIIDSRSAVDALFQNSRASGVVAGTGSNHCFMRYVPITAEVKIGDEVLSSGLGDIYPKGLKLGTVSGVTKATQGLFQDITVVPSADLTRLEEVLVLLS